MRLTTAFLPRSDKIAMFSDVTKMGLSTDADNFEVEDPPPRVATKGSLFRHWTVVQSADLESAFVL